MFKGEVFRGIGQLVKVVDWFRILCLDGPVVLPKGDSGDGADVFNLVFFVTLYQFEKGIFTFAPDNAVYFREVGEEVLPEKCGGNAAKNYFYIRVDLFGNLCYSDAAPAVCLENGKTDYIGFFSASTALISSGDRPSFCQLTISTS
jgi:hypothetical protein